MTQSKLCDWESRYPATVQWRCWRSCLLLAACLGFCGLLESSQAQGWKITTSPSLPWRAVAASADFTKLIATGSTHFIDYNCIPACTNFVSLPIYRSTDSGATWAQTGAPSNYWVAIASSADGSNLVAAADFIYTSRDSGMTWVQSSAPDNLWTAIASSADGVKLVALGGGCIYTSPDSGVTWLQTSAPTNNWVSVASSADGNRLIAANWGNPEGAATYFSPDAGTNWFQALSPYTNSGASVACSADGKTLFALSTNYQVFSSTDSGASWKPTTGSSGPLACSADGLIVTSGPDSISENRGSSWTDLNPPGVAPCDMPIVALAADGQKLLSVFYDDSQPWMPYCPGQLWIWTPPITNAVLPHLLMRPSDSNLRLSWTVPSSAFQLQQSSDLTGTNWIPVEISPTLNLSNLQNEVTISTTASRRFYRLKQQ